MLSDKIVEWLDHEQFLIFLRERKAGEVRHANGARKNYFPREEEAIFACIRVIRSFYHSECS